MRKGCHNCYNCIPDYGVCGIFGGIALEEIEQPNDFNCYYWISLIEIQDRRFINKDVNIGLEGDKNDI